MRQRTDSTGICQSARLIQSLAIESLTQITMESENPMVGIVRPAEKLLLEPWQSGFRMAYGFCLLMLIVKWRGTQIPWWELLLLFLGALVVLRIAPLLPRKILPFSATLKGEWFKQRQLAKHYDSYQWAKLLWIGAGMTAYAIKTGRIQERDGVLALSCVATGIVGTVLWKRVQAAVARTVVAANA